MQNTRGGASDSTFKKALDLHRRGKLAEAQALYLEILRRDPSMYPALQLLGIMAVQQKRFEDAVGLFDQVLAIEPRHLRALMERGNALQLLGRPEEAAKTYDRLLAIEPDHAEALNNLGNVQQRLGRLGAALDSYDKALAARPDYAEVLSNRGNALKRLDRLDAALDSFDRALAIRPDYPDALYNRGNALLLQDRPADALVDFDRALVLRPEYAEAHNNRGNALRALRRHDEAIACYERALAIKPDFAQALTNRGIALKDLKRLDQALEFFVSAQSIRPDYVELPWNEGLCRLLLGDFADGWRLYEYRWQCNALRHARRDFAQPLWLGDEDIAGKTVLLHAEQGMGDTIQFCRYAKLVAARGATVLMEVQPPLRRLLSDLDGVSRVIAKGEALADFDLHCPMLSLPLAFRTMPETIPAQIPYLRANQDRVDMWRKKLGPKSRPRVGIAWSGGPATINDRDRSIALSQFTGLINDDAEFFSLQKDVRTTDRAAFESRNDIVHFGADFVDTAALMELMDVVVTVDTSIGHLAGALGRPVWILLPYVPDWRWMLDRDTSPWYPTVRLLRQPALADWPSVIAEAASRIKRLGA